MGNLPVKIIAETNSWIETKAVEQLENALKYPGMIKVYGMPDLHPGKGIAIGAVAVSEGMIYPHLIGNDIGCGMAFFETEAGAHEFKQNKVFEKLLKYSLPYELEEQEAELPKKIYGMEAGLGTIGKGNHFAEFLKLTEVYDSQLLEKLGIERKKLFFLVHSGSRGYGEAAYRRFIEIYQAQNGFKEGSDEFISYFQEHDKLLKWAGINRNVIAQRILKASGINAYKKILDIPHNFLEKKEGSRAVHFYHRKGAAPADRGAVLIPGSRGSLSYLVMPLPKEKSGFSVAHGAGRKWDRGGCRKKLEGRYTRETIRKNIRQNRVVCTDTDLLFEEAPEAYKNIDEVIQTLENYGLIKKIAGFSPVITYKG